MIPGMTLYSTLIRPLAFRLDPETAHRLAISSGARLGWASCHAYRRRAAFD
jgi:dihydroorotate dehydrogenase